MVVHLILNLPNWEFKEDILVSLHKNDPFGKNQEIKTPDPEQVALSVRLTITFSITLFE